MYKLQVQEDDGVWRDVKDGSGELLTFAEETEARQSLERLFPVLVQLDRYAAGPKRTRVLVIYGIDDEEEEDDKNSLK
jgi:hypothetical protein